jgi:hypothetical protein
MFNCCCGTTSGSCVFNVTSCGSPASIVAITVTQTSGGSYTATLSGSSPITFGSLPDGTYSYTVTVTGYPPKTGTFTVTGSGTTTVNVSFTSPSTGFICSCCGPAGVLFPTTLTLTSGEYGAVTLTWSAFLSIWVGSQVVTSSGFAADGTPGTVSYDLSWQVSCSGYDAATNSTTFVATHGWTVVGGRPFGSTSAYRCVSPITPFPQIWQDGGIGPDTLGGLTQSCASPINLAFATRSDEPDCSLVTPGTSVTVTA